MAGARRSGKSVTGTVAWALGAVIFGVVAVLIGMLLTEPALAQAATTGAVTSFGDAAALGAPAGSQLNAPIVGMAATPDGRGYWLLAADGGVFTYGDARFFGSGAGRSLRPYVGIATTPGGSGYWLVDDGGDVRNYGNAPDLGGISAGQPPVAPVVGMASTADGRGYWLAGADGGVFSFGDAHFYGSTGTFTLNSPVVGMASTADGRGYWLVAADGGVFTFGDARFYGSLGATPPPSNTPVTAMAAAPAGGGYWFTTSDKALPPSGPVPSVLSRCNEADGAPTVRPSSIVLACGDGNASLTHLVWSSWTATGATGSGEFTHNTCTPDCADGTFVSTGTSVRLAYPVETGAGREFASVSYTSSTGGRLSGVTTLVLTSAG